MRHGGSLGFTSFNNYLWKITYPETEYVKNIFACQDRVKSVESLYSKPIRLQSAFIHQYVRDTIRFGL